MNIFMQINGRDQNQNERGKNATTKSEEHKDVSGEIELGRRKVENGVGGEEIHNIILTWQGDNLTAVNSKTSKSYRILFYFLFVANL